MHKLQLTIHPPIALKQYRHYAEIYAKIGDFHQNRANSLYIFATCFGYLRLNCFFAS
jgi:hypothetical protein